MAKKSTNQAAASAETEAPHPMDEIYTAHQVHTLAQLTFQQVAGARSWAPGAADPMAPAYGVQRAWPAMPKEYGPIPGTPPGVVYWYP